MWAFAFFTRQAANWQDKTWLKIDEVTPYNIRHVHQRGVMRCVGDFHFRRYCGPSRTLNDIHKSSKRKKLYWYLHPEYKDWT